MVSVNQTTDFAGHIKPDSLNPDIVCYYVVCFSTSSSSAGFNNKTSTTTTPVVATVNSSMTGTFRTAPNYHLASSGDGGNRSISLFVGGALGGQNYCRRFWMSTSKLSNIFYNANIIS